MRQVIKTIVVEMTLLILGLSALFSCGGDTSITPQPPQQSTQPTSAILTLSTVVTGTIPPSVTINSYDVTVTLPDGVTVKSTVNPPEIDYGVVTATGSAAGSLISAVYTAATSTQAGTVQIHIVNGDGFSAGEFSIVNCDIAAGAYPKPSNFEPPIFDDATGFDSSSNSTVLGLEEELYLKASVVIY